MARIVHGFHLGRKKYYYLLILAAIIFSLFLVLWMKSAGAIAVEDVLNNLLISLMRLAAVYAICLVLALTIAISIGQKKIGEFLIPFFDLLQNLPSFALIPVFVSLFGYSNKMVIIFAATSVIWPILFYVLYALKRGRPELNDAATIFGAVGFRRAVFYYLPLIFPAAITGSIVGLSIGWEAVIGIEILGMENGIGKFLNSSLSQDKAAFSLGLVMLLLFVFIINRFIWLPLLKKVQNYGE